MNDANDDRRSKAESREGARSALTMILGRGAMQLVAVATALLLPRFMDTTDYGRFVSVVALASLGGALVELGLNWVEMRLMAPAWRRGDTVEALRIGSTTFFIKLLLDLGVSFFLLGWLALTPGLGLGAAELGWIGLWLLARYGFAFTAAMHLPLGLRRIFVGLDLARAFAHLSAALAGYAWGGLSGAFVALALIQLPLLGYALRSLRHHLPVGPRSVSPALVWNQRHFMAWTAVTALLSGVQFWLPVFLVGGHLDLAEAAILGIAVQGLGILHGLGVGLRQGLLPIIADFSARGDDRRCLKWSSLLMRLGTAAATAGLLVWLVVGPALLGWLLPPDYGGLFQGVALMLVAFVALNAAATSDSLLTLRGHAAISAVNLAFFTLITVAGTGLVVFGSWSNGALWVAAVYALAASILALTSRFSLGMRGGLWLPVGRTLLLFLPGLLLLPLAWSDSRWPVWTALPLVFSYALYVVALRLVTVDELRRIRAMLGA